MNPLIITFYGVDLFVVRKYNEAVNTYQDAITIEPSIHWHHKARSGRITLQEGLKKPMTYLRLLGAMIQKYYRPLNRDTLRMVGKDCSFHIINYAKERFLASK